MFQKRLIQLFILVLLLLCATVADAQEASTEVRQGQISINTLNAPGSSSGSGGYSGGSSTEFPVNWPNPLQSPMPPNFPFYGGPYRTGPEAVPFELMGRYQQKYDRGMLRKNEEAPGGYIFREKSIYVKKGFVPFTTFTSYIPPNNESIERWQRCYEIMGVINLEGVPEKTEKRTATTKDNLIATNRKLDAVAGGIACETGAPMVLVVRSDFVLEQYGDSGHKGASASPGVTSGGPINAFASLFNIFASRSIARVGASTKPNGLYILCAPIPGTKYVEYRPQPKKAPKTDQAVLQTIMDMQEKLHAIQMDLLKRGVKLSSTSAADEEETDIEETAAKGKRSLPSKKPPKSVLYDKTTRP